MSAVHELIARDGLACWLCGQPCRLDVEDSHPMRASADHVHARRWGGHRQLPNLRLAHSWCNRKRGPGLVIKKRVYINGLKDAVYRYETRRMGASVKTPTLRAILEGESSR